MNLDSSLKRQGTGSSVLDDKTRVIVWIKLKRKITLEEKITMTTIDLDKIPFGECEDFCSYDAANTGIKGIKLEADLFPGVAKGKYDFFIDLATGQIQLVEKTKNTRYSFKFTLQVEENKHSSCTEDDDKFADNLPSDEFFYGKVEKLTKKEKKKALVEGLRKFRNQAGIPPSWTTKEHMTAVLDKWLEHDDNDKRYFHEIFGGDPDSDEFDQEKCDRNIEKIVSKSMMVEENKHNPDDEPFMKTLPPAEFFYGEICEDTPRSILKKSLLVGIKLYSIFPDMHPQFVTEDALKQKLYSWIENDTVISSIVGDKKDKVVSKVLKKLAEYHDFCPGCGGKTGNMFCNACSQAIVEDHNVCPKCLYEYGQDDDTTCRCTNPKLKRKQYSAKELGNILIKQNASIGS